MSQPALTANTHSRIRHRAVGSPYLYYVKWVLFLTAESVSYSHIIGRKYRCSISTFPAFGNPRRLEPDVNVE